jgi:hypothetical protein
MKESSMPRRTRTVTAPIVLAAVVILLAGCSSSQSPASAPAVTPSGTTAPPLVTTSASPSPTAITSVAASPSLAATPSEAPTPTSASHAPAHAHGSNPVVTVGASSDGTTIYLVRGQRLTVKLSSTYWQFGPVTGTVLTASGQQTTPSRTQSGSTCVPGQGCGTAAETFTARRSGRTRITASRSSCGEAMACVGRAGHFELVVVVR